MTTITMKLPFAVTAQGRQRNKTIMDKRTGFCRSWNYMPKKSKDMQTLVSSFASSHMKRNGLKPIQGACELSFRVCFVPPRGWSKKKRDEALRGKLRHITKPDSDNIEKLIRDSMNEICYVDDKLIWKHGGEKVYGSDESTLIEIIEE